MRKIRSIALRIGLMLPFQTLVCSCMQIGGGGGLKACPESPFDTFTKLKTEKGKWKVSTVLVIPCSTRNLLMLLKEKLSELTLNQVQVARNHSPLQGRGQGEGSSRRVKSCNELFNFSTLQLLNFKEGGKLCCQ